MAKQLFVNNKSTVIAEFLNPNDATITVGSSAGFPVPTDGDWFIATIAGVGLFEVVRVNAVNGNNWTVVRGYEGTVPRLWLPGTVIECRVTAGTLDYLRDNSPIVNLFDYASPADAFAASDVVTIPDGKTYVGDFDVPSGKTLINNGVVDGTIRVGAPAELGGGAVAVSDLVEVSGTAGIWTNYPVGTTTFPGDFSAYSPGDICNIRLRSAGNGTINQNGYDFLVVQSADSSQITFTSGTRLAYDQPNIFKCVAAFRYTGILTKNQFSIPGNYTSMLSVGDIVRIENVDGTDTIDGTKFYFEMLRVVGISTGQVTFDSPFAYTHENPWIVKANYMEDITIRGGKCTLLSVNWARNIRVYDVETQQFGAFGLYDFLVEGCTADRDVPRVFGFTYCRNGTVNGVNTKGARGTTDNGAFKILTCQNVSFSNITAFDSRVTSGSQGIYPFIADYFFTPYKGFNDNCTFNNIKVTRPSQGASRSAWFIGMRNSSVNGVAGDSTILIERDVGTVYTGLATPSVFEMLNCRDTVVSGFNAAVANFTGVDNVKVTGSVRGAFGGNSARANWIRAGTGGIVGISQNSHISVKVRGGQSGDHAFYIQNATNINLGDSSDVPGLSKSVTLGAGVTGLKVGMCDFNNPRDTWAESYSPTISGGTTSGTATYTTQYSTAQKVGRYVMCRGQVTWASHTGTGALRVTLPFTSNASTGMEQQLSAVLLGATRTESQVYLRIQPGSQFATLYQVDLNGVETTIGVPVAGTLRFSGIYEI